MNAPLPAERKLYRWFVNVSASVLLVLIWKFSAHYAVRFGWAESEDHLFMMIVAVTLALNLPSQRRTT